MRNHLSTCTCIILWLVASALAVVSRQTTSSNLTHLRPLNVTDPEVRVNLYNIQGQILAQGNGVLAPAWIIDISKAWHAGFLPPTEYFNFTLAVYKDRSLPTFSYKSCRARLVQSPRAAFAGAPFDMLDTLNCD